MKIQAVWFGVLGLVACSGAEFKAADSDPGNVSALNGSDASLPGVGSHEPGPDRPGPHETDGSIVGVDAGLGGPGAGEVEPPPSETGGQGGSGATSGAAGGSSSGSGGRDSAGGAPIGSAGGAPIGSSGGAPTDCAAIQCAEPECDAEHTPDVPAGACCPECVPLECAADSAPCALLDCAGDTPAVANSSQDLMSEVSPGCCECDKPACEAPFESCDVVGCDTPERDAEGCCLCPIAECSAEVQADFKSFRTELLRSERNECEDDDDCEWVSVETACGEDCGAFVSGEFDDYASMLQTFAEEVCVECSSGPTACPAFAPSRPKGHCKAGHCR